MALKEPLFWLALRIAREVFTRMDIILWTLQKYSSRESVAQLVFQGMAVFVWEKCTSLRNNLAELLQPFVWVNIISKAPAESQSSLTAAIKSGQWAEGIPLRPSRDSQTAVQFTSSAFIQDRRFLP